MVCILLYTIKAGSAMTKNQGNPSKDSQTDDSYEPIPHLNILTRDVLFEIEFRDTGDRIDVFASERCAGETESAWGELNRWQVKDLHDWLGRWLALHPADQ
jgi:hypothetical protein